MTFMLRDRPDGQFEIIVQRPHVIGVFAERDYAEKVCLFLQDDDDLGQVSDAPANFAKAAADVAELETDALAALGDAPAEVRVLDLSPPPQTPKPRQDHAATVQLPAVVDAPTRTALLPVVQPKNLTEAQIAEAFDRIALGEKIGVVAPDFGLSFGVLRGMWANHKRKLQKHLAEGGQVPCTGCRKMFTPSISSPDKCARCNHD